MISETTQRVAQHTKKEINAQIRRNMEMRIKAFAASPETINYRLQELEKEWDIERLLETNGSVLLLFGLALTAVGSRRWLILPAMVGGFCLQHAFQGWCPPLELFRRLGVRTAREIEEERVALKALRGDFDEVDKTPLNPRTTFTTVMNAVRR